MAMPDPLRQSLAATAAQQLPRRGGEPPPPIDFAGSDSGHVMVRGMHVGWAWGSNTAQGIYLDVLSEHRMTGMSARRYWSDGSTEAIPTPREFRTVLTDPEEDARSKVEFTENNRRIYADLRARGLLPPAGQNVASQDINEYLRTRPSGD